MFVNNAFIGALNSADRQVSFTWAAFWSMVINLALNGVLIPLFGYMGAATATVLTEIALAAICWVLTARHLGPLPVFRLSWRIVVAGLVMGAALFPLRDVTGWPTIFVIAGAAAVYGAAVLALRTFDAEEWAVVRRAVQVRT
jgi:O-antigen/teichoic acid export membrane protein